MRLRCICLALCLAIPAGALGQVRQAALERIRLLNKKAMDEFDGLEFDVAKAALVEALEAAKEAKLVKSKSLATTYMNLGLVYGAGLNERDNAVEAFANALLIDADLALDPMRATPAIEEMFKAAKKEAEKKRKAAQAAQFKHTPVDEAKVAKPVILKVKVGRSSPVDQVILYYRIKGQTAFTRIIMKAARAGHYQGVIPADQVKGGSIHYFVVAQDETGQRVNGNGSASSPNIIRVVGRSPKPGPGPGPKPEPMKRRKYVSIAVMVGAGGGFVYGGRTENANASIEGDDQGQTEDAGPGGALAPFHISPEISYHINEKWHIALLGRIQVVNLISKDKHKTWTSNISPLGVIRAKRYFGGDSLRFYMAFGAGGGQIRHRIPVKEDWDTRVAQYVAFNLGGGLNYMFTDFMGLVVDLGGFILVPDFAAHLDLNLGLVLSF